MVLTGLRIADDPATWAALGFTVEDDRVLVGGVEIQLIGSAAGSGVLGWSVHGLHSSVLPAIDTVAPMTGTVTHPNGVIAVDHIVAFTGNIEDTMAALAADGLEARRVREVPDSEMRQAFYVLGTALLELGGPVEGESTPRFWGITLAVSDLDALAERLGPLFGAPRDAIQPGRRIATLRREAGSSVPLAFITPR
ncbi:MAG: glyoxalase [Solirubrobacteraceae bacterium]